MKCVYPAIFHCEDGGYWVEFPDLPGCFSDGENEAEAAANAAESLRAYLQTKEEIGQKFPKASALASVKYSGAGFSGLVCAEISDGRRSVKKTLSLPSWLNTRAEAAGVNFNHALQDGLRAALGI